MLDSIHEIFDILNIDFESVHFNLIEYKNYEDLSFNICIGKCPVVDVLHKYIFDSSFSNYSTVMVATGIKKENDIEYIQLKYSNADNPNEKGKVHF